VAGQRDLPTLFLRTEGAVLLALSAFFYWLTDESLVFFLVLFLAPDLGFLGYLGGPRAGAWVYNVLHSYLLPAVLVAVGSLTDRGPALLTFGLIWFAHIGTDRMLGYGLKHTSGFRDTHLGRIGRQATGKR
jgi:hypothetical protein